MCSLWRLLRRNSNIKQCLQFNFSKGLWTLPLLGLPVYYNGLWKHSKEHHSPNALYFTTFTFCCNSCSRSCGPVVMVSCLPDIYPSCQACMCATASPSSHPLRGVNTQLLQDDCDFCCIHSSEETQVSSSVQNTPYHVTRWTLSERWTQQVSTKTFPIDQRITPFKSWLDYFLSF